MTIVVSVKCHAVSLPCAVGGISRSSLVTIVNKKIMLNLPRLYHGACSPTLIKYGTIAHVNYNFELVVSPRV